MRGARCARQTVLLVRSDSAMAAQVMHTGAERTDVTLQRRSALDGYGQRAAEVLEPAALERVGILETELLHDLLHKPHQRQLVVRVHQTRLTCLTIVLDRRQAHMDIGINYRELPP